MSFLSVNKEKYTQEFSGTGGKYLRNKSGMYPVTIKHAVLDVTKNGAHMVNLIVDYNGTANTLYGVYCITKSNGEANEVGREQIGKLMVVCGLEDISEPETAMVPGRDNKAEERTVMVEFSDCPVVLHIKRKYELYNGKIAERIQIQNVFEADTYASAVELTNKGLGEEVEVGKQYRIEEAYAENDILADGVTQEMVDAFHAEKRSKSKPAQDNKPATGLGSSGRFGNKG